MSAFDKFFIKGKKTFLKNQPLRGGAFQGQAAKKTKTLLNAIAKDLKADADILKNASGILPPPIHLGAPPPIPMDMPMPAPMMSENAAVAAILAGMQPALQGYKPTSYRQYLPGDGKIPKISTTPFETSAVFLEQFPNACLLRNSDRMQAQQLANQASSATYQELTKSIPSTLVCARNPDTLAFLQRRGKDAELASGPRCAAAIPLRQAARKQASKVGAREYTRAYTYARSVDGVPSFLRCA